MTVSVTCLNVENRQWLEFVSNIHKQPYHILIYEYSYCTNTVIDNIHANLQKTVISKWGCFIWKAKSYLNPQKEVDVAQSPAVHMSASFRTSLATRNTASISPGLTLFHPLPPRSFPVAMQRLMIHHGKQTQSEGR